jgi:hypothetical protein
MPAEGGSGGFILLNRAAAGIPQAGSCQQQKIDPATDPQTEKIPFHHGNLMRLFDLPPRPLMRLRSM